MAECFSTVNKWIQKAHTKVITRFELLGFFLLGWSFDKNRSAGLRWIPYHFKDMGKCTTSITKITCLQSIMTAQDPVYHLVEQFLSLTRFTVHSIWEIKNMRVGRKIGNYCSHSLLKVLVTHRPQKAFSLLHFFSLTNCASSMKDDLATSDGITMEDKAALR